MCIHAHTYMCNYTVYFMCIYIYSIFIRESMDGLISEDHDNQDCLVEDLLDRLSSLAEQMGLPHDTDTLCPQVVLVFSIPML